MLTNDQIIEMAKQTLKYQEESPEVSGVIAFARLIAEAQREEDARICENLPWKFRTEFCPPVKDECAAAIRNSGGAA